MYRRPIINITIALILGIIIQYYLRLPIKIIYIISFAHLMLLIIFIYLKQRGKTIIIFLAILFLGALHLEYEYNTEDYIKIFANKKVGIIGVCEQKYISDRSVYILHVSNIKYKGKNYKLNSKILFKIFDYEGKSLNNKKIIVRGRVKIPDKARNPKMFDYNLYLKTQGINATLNTNGYNIKVIDTGDLPLLIKLRHRIKSYVYVEALNILPDDEGKLALSITFGDKRIIEESIYSFFKASGTAHTLAVSGLHFGILFVFIDFILKNLKIKEKYKSLILILLIWVFAFIVGFSPSVIRASSMITLSVSANLIDRRYDLFSALALICLINTIINPFMIFNIGFQLSFLAVISIALFYRPIYERLGILPGLVRKMFAATLSAQIYTLPIIAYHFNIFSPIALIINIPVVLLITIILPLNLIFFILLFININIAKFIAFFDKILIKQLIIVNSISTYFPFASFNVISPSLLFLVTFYIGTIIVLHKHKIPQINKYEIRHVISIFLVIIIIVNSFKFVYSNKLKITFVDVGQGDCILIETPKGKNILIDGGKYKKGFLSKFLLKNHISYIDLICVTHIHDDHIGGVIDVIENINFGSVVIGTKLYSCEEYKELANKCFAENTPIRVLSRGMTIDLEKDLSLTSINPATRVMNDTHDDVNNNSLVCILKYKELEVLLTGDIEKEAEEEIIREVSRQDIDVIKVCHHGSNTSNIPEFIDYFNPEIAVIQVGKNTFGHPHRDTIETLRKKGIEIYRNDTNGAVIIVYDGKKIKIDTMIE
ncbi:DNA internalization-related competence protein ComEC/Rec2 [Paramaledivibacter caminithermalis]|jgi:competence protein ComEC|uniref:Competence protein ComEC n=1 Tax=Paramaledivibacter caminithermalis (strain DSM 15212 / CIP 107654 / DViRD3) TaxID=1121301 RepID=A0A1M6M6I3_PARC5|nr:DNA internalization-related competence protein ComEC/Rec2 [Paramaledivibacter caminithermalis]SHJ79000.1 competence protein ComEC [Paramaledivibacter caminithermalis DSM 15212]